MIEDTRIPQFTREQVEYLDRMFPEQTPDLDWPDRKIWARAGQRQLVRFLQSNVAEQEEDILHNSNR